MITSAPPVDEVVVPGTPGKLVILLMGDVPLAPRRFTGFGRGRRCVVLKACGAVAVRS